MKKPTYRFLRFCMIYSCILAAVAGGIYLYIYFSGIGARTAMLAKLASELSSAPVAVMLIAAIGSVCIEDAIRT